MAHRPAPSAVSSDYSLTGPVSDFPHLEAIYQGLEAALHFGANQTVQLPDELIHITFESNLCAVARWEKHNLLLQTANLAALEFYGKTHQDRFVLVCNLRTGEDYGYLDAGYSFCRKDPSREAPRSLKAAAAARAAAARTNALPTPPPSPTPTISETIPTPTVKIVESRPITNPHGGLQSVMFLIWLGLSISMFQAGFLAGVIMSSFLLLATKAVFRLLAALLECRPSSKVYGKAV